MNGPIPRGYEPNDAGHIIAHRLGGGIDEHNIIPQSSHINKGAWKKEVEDLVHKMVLDNGEALFTVKPVYRHLSTRPYKILYRIESGGSVVANDMVNPKILKKEKPILSKLSNKDVDVPLDWIEERPFGNRRVMVDESNANKRKRLEDGADVGGYETDLANELNDLSIQPNKRRRLEDVADEGGYETDIADKLNELSVDPNNV